METNNMKIFFTFLFIGFFGTIYAQEMKEISPDEFVEDMKTIIQKMNNDDFSMKFKKEVYKDLKTNELITESNGIMYHGIGKTYRSENDGITIIQNNKLYVIIDSTTKTVQITKPDSSFNPGAAITNLSSDLLKAYKLYRTENGTFYSYKVIPANLSEGTIEYYVNAKTALIYKMVISYPPANYFSDNIDDETVEEPYAIVIYEPIQALSSQDKQELFQLDFLLNPIEANRFNLTDAYKDFQLFDARYFTN